MRKSMLEKNRRITTSVITTNRAIRVNSSVAGFSLLEIIIVLALLGFILAGAAIYAQKIIDEKKRNSTAEAVVQEIYGILRYVNEERINATVRRGTAASTDIKIINPLYQQFSYPVSEDGADINNTGMQNNYVYQLKLPQQGLVAPQPTNGDISPYISRVYSQNVSSLIEAQGAVGAGGRYFSYPLKWGEIWGNQSVRRYFTDSGCGPAGVVTGNNNANAVSFRNQFISCEESPLLRRSELAISRVDLVNNQGTLSRRDGNASSVAVSRVDVYVTFIPADGNTNQHAAHIVQYINPLMDAFSNKHLIADPEHIYLVRSKRRANMTVNGNSRFDASNDWQLLNKTNGLPYRPHPPLKECDNNCAKLADIANLVGHFEDGYNYAIRFSFDGVGEPLRTDGLNSATRICWNTDTGMPGPCIQAPYTDLLTVKQRDNPDHYANLQVANLVSAQSHTEVDGTVVAEYNTVPKIEYKTFTNNGILKAYFWRKKPRSNRWEYCINGGTPANPSSIQNCCDEGATNCQWNYDTLQIADARNGAIAIPAQICPDIDNWHRPGTTNVRTLYPRLSVAVSSMVAALAQDGHGGRDNPDREALGGGDDTATSMFINQEQTMIEFARSEMGVHRFGGVVFQVYLDDTRPAGVNNDVWRIAARVNTEDVRNNGHSWTYYNPRWLSVVVSTWCSSVPQLPTPAAP